MNYYYRGKYRRGAKLSCDGTSARTQKQAQREFGDDYKFIKVVKNGVFGVPK